MTTTIIAIGNSKGIRIPKILLEESGIKNMVKLEAKRGEIRILKAPEKKQLQDTSILSENALGVDWNRPEEDKAWESLQ